MASVESQTLSTDPLADPRANLARICLIYPVESIYSRKVQASLGRQPQIVDLVNPCVWHKNLPGNQVIVLDPKFDYIAIIAGGPCYFKAPKGMPMSLTTWVAI